MAVHGCVLFYLGNFFMGIERAIAVLTMPQYEKCVSSLITFLIVSATVRNVWKNVIVELGLTGYEKQ